MAEPIPGGGEVAPIPTQQQVIEEATDARKQYKWAHDREVSATEAMDQIPERLERAERNKEYYKTMIGHADYRVRVDLRTEKKLNSGPVENAEQARERLEKLQQIEALSAAYALVKADIEDEAKEVAEQDSISPEAVEDGEHRRAVSKLRTNSALFEAQTHLRANEDAYKQEAVDDARAAGEEVNYPPYTGPATPDAPAPTQPPPSPEMAPEA